MSVGERLHSAWTRVSALFRRRQLERDLDDELSFHLAMREEKYGASGQGAEEARRAALRRFGNRLALKEACRDMWTFVSLETLAQDVRFAGRVLVKSPAFTAVAVLSLALGIGGNAAMFSLVNAVLLRPLPYPDSDRLVRLTGSYPKGAVVALQEQSRTLDIAGVGAAQELNLIGQGEAARVVGSTVSANLFTVLGRGPALGRTFEPGDDRPGRDEIVVLSHALWQSRFGGNLRALGLTITLEGVERRIVGVMPPGFHFPSGSVQVWVPLRLDPSRTEDYWGFGWMPLVARLRPGVTLSQGQDELRVMIARITTLFPWPNPRWNADATVTLLQDDLVRDLRPKLVVLQTAVGMVLLIACANVASLLLSRAAARGREMALRAALGASRGRILRQLLTESVVLSLLGGTLGVSLALAVLSGLQAVLPADVRGFSVVAVDAGALGFVTGLSVLCGLLFGLVPAANASRVDLAASMKAGGQRALGTRGRGLRSSFIVGEVALAVVLAVGAGLLIRTLWSLTRADPGFRPQQTLTVRVSPNPATCLERSACVALFDELLRRIQGLNGITDAAAVNAVPFSGEQPLLPVEMEGHPLVSTEAVAPLLWAGAVTSGYFRVLHIPVLQGRGLEDADAERAAPVVVVSAATAKRYWPGENPIGKRIRVVWDQDWRTVVGVVGDVRQYSLSGRSPAEITGAAYMPYPQSVALNRQIPRAMSLVVLSSADPSDVAARLRALVAGVDPDVPVSDVRSMEAVVASSAEEPRSMMWLFAGFAGCALLLAAIGTYGVVSYSTAQRTYEIGVRVAIGATRGDIFGLVLGQSLRLVLAGLALGVGAALLLGRALSGFLYGVKPTDPLTFVVVVALLVLTALLAGYLPGRRAAATDPVRALRAE
ncbi:MAG TPA: ABC transporter permease [Vicinamibacteria bacterium]|nr:ABC transporter permease [Vicinamibacteria bacterium]